MPQSQFLHVGYMVFRERKNEVFVKLLAERDVNNVRLYIRAHIFISVHYTLTYKPWQCHIKAT